VIAKRLVCKTIYQSRCTDRMAFREDRAAHDYSGRSSDMKNWNPEARVPAEHQQRTLKLWLGGIGIVVIAFATSLVSIQTHTLLGGTSFRIGSLCIWSGELGQGTNVGMNVPFC
jgi:hypothetical protein